MVESRSNPSGAPGVVATIVVHPPQPHLAELAASLAAQDYPNLQVLVLVADAPGSAVDEVAAVVRAHLPAAHIRAAGADLGFGPTANQVLGLVEGDSGFFLLMHDDVALMPDAVSRLVEEIFRSNAAMVGPKIVDWDDARILQSVGFAVDRFGELDDGLEPRELDQEQHDAIRDVFALSSACLLIRADVFRQLKGFDPSIRFHGEGLDLCWRAHLLGGRVVVVPSAVARHRGRFHERRPDLVDDFEIERQRVMTVASLSGRSWLIVPVLILVNLAAAITSIVRGRGAMALARFGSLASLVTSAPSIRRRRRRIARLRLVPPAEVAAMQTSGSVRVARFTRRRSTARRARRRVSNETRSPVIVVAWSLLVLLLLVGSRQLWSSGVRPIGEILPLPESPIDALRSYASGWWERGLGGTKAQPSGLFTVGVAGLIAFAQMAWLETFAVVGAVLVGWLGVARLVAISADPRARAAGLVVYAAVPLPYAAVASGRSAVLVAYALVPWALHFARRLSGLGGSIVGDPVMRRNEVIDHPSAAMRLSLVARLTLVVAIAFAFSPSAAVVIVLALLVLALGGVVGGGDLRAAGSTAASAVVGAVGAFVLNVPWSLQYVSGDGWARIVGRPGGGTVGLDVWEILRFGVGPSALGGLIIGAFIPLVVVVFVARRWRYVWAIRAILLSAVFLALASASSTSSGPIDLPEIGVLLAPVAVGLALGATLLVASFSVDVRGGRFGLRQPITLLGLLAISSAVLPVVSVAVDGSWDQPSASIVEQLDELLAEPSSGGDYRVLVVGDPDLVPGAEVPYSDGVAYSVTSNGTFDIGSMWYSPSDLEERTMADLLDALSQRTTTRVGRLMAPFGIRYVVIPKYDRVRSTADSPLPVADGLVSSFAEQLDFTSVYSPSSLTVFENTQWIPLTAVLGVEAAANSVEGGAGALVRSDVGGAQPILEGASAWSESTQRIAGGVVHLGVPFDDRWTLRVDGESVEGRGSFGSVMSFDASAGGNVSLAYSSPITRLLWIIVHIALWIAVFVGVLQPARRRRGRAENVDSPVMSLSSSEIVS
ncbi:MAG: hypothetical protein B7C54_11250 [Acidimicrobiales bacterium mtb01]|nr:glycosyltransferase family 2 protein [Actinomycetota bacterium]TEX45627.1 MAG: hypothetical protein B7C54_11250 [Acidimicrobiales bacterium mtb01]